MLTLDYTEGFDQGTLDKMNMEVQEEMGYTEIEDYDSLDDYHNHLQWAEEAVLKKYGGA